MAMRKTGTLKGKAKGKAKGKNAPKGRAADATTADAVHQIWLAGMGALARAQKDGPKAFEKLIRDGGEFIEHGKSGTGHLLGKALASAQAAVGARLTATRETATETWKELEHLFHDRVETVLHQTGIPTAAEIRGLAKRIDQLSAHVEQLAAAKVAKAKPAKAKRARPRKAKATPAAPAPG
jgi:poly(hydroxyalkanoate) granule-associated protein